MSTVPNARDAGEPKNPEHGSIQGGGRRKRPSRDPWERVTGPLKAATALLVLVTTLIRLL